MLYLARGSLPWLGLPEFDGKFEKILEMKELLDCRIACKDLNSVFYDFLTYSRQLKFKEKPQYDHWIKRFMDVRSQTPASEY